MTLRKVERYSRDLRRRVDALAVPKAVGEQFGRYRDDPVGFLRDVCGFESATRRSTGEAYQFRILQDLAEHPRVAIRSGHGVGKSTVDAWAAIWWLTTRPLSRVVVVAPEFTRQVKAVLFSEIRKWVRRSREPLPLIPRKSRVEVDGFGEEWGAIGLPATEPDRIEGFHADGGVLLILDETKGIPPEVYDALQGALSGLADNRLLVTSTPGPPSGKFYEICTKGLDSWRVHHIPSADASPVSDAWVEQRKAEWGEGSPIYAARVRGEFPEEAEGTLLRLADLDAAVGREIEQPEGVTCSAGVDVARFGEDASAFALWRGKRLVGVELKRQLDTMAVTAWCASLINQHRPTRIGVDTIGIGSGVYDRLRQMGYRGVRPINVSEAASRPHLFRNRRAEIYWQLREALERGEVSLPRDDALLAELSSIRYGYTPSGQIILEPKDETRKRIGRSPDRADAVALGLAVAGGYEDRRARRFVHRV